MLTVLSNETMLCCFQRGLAALERSCQHPVCVLLIPLFLCGRPTHRTDEILPCDLQGAVTLPRMKRGGDDNTITRSQPSLWNDFRACLSRLLYRCLTAAGLWALLALGWSHLFFVFRKENEHWRKKRREGQVQVRSADPGVSEGKACAES